MKKLVITLTALLMAFTTSLRAATPTKITAPEVITASGNYVLANDIVGTIGSGPEATIAIFIQASDVTLNLNGHTINAGQQALGIGIAQFVGNDTNNPTLTNVRVSNGKIIAASGITIGGSDCLVSGLNITIGTSGIGVNLSHGNFNRVHDCVLNAPNGSPLGNQARAAFELSLASHNTIQNCILIGIYVDTIEEDDQAGTFATVIGDNTFSGIQFANPTQ
jgi:hypothetical protein